MDVQWLKSEFRTRFGGDCEAVACAPGRVNLIGEHTDYHEGFVFPAAIELGVWIAARPVAGPSRLYSSTLPGVAEFDVLSVDPSTPGLGWGNFSAGMAWAMREAGREVRNLEAFIHSTVPIGGGVSSSAAIEMALGVLWSHFAGQPFQPKEIALLGRVAENRFVGKQSGIMDQMASANGRADHAMFLDTRSLEIRYAPIPAHLRLVICDTKVSHAGDDHLYNWAREGSFLACEKLGVKVLRDVTLDELEATRGRLDEREYRSAHHVVSENLRALDFADALDRGELGRVGSLMAASHHSLQYDYRVSCAELDVMAELARGTEGCVGARMTGGGFGGACIALVEADSVGSFVGAVASRYRLKTGIEPVLTATCAVKGAHLLHV